MRRSINGLGWLFGLVLAAAPSPALAGYVAGVTATTTMGTGLHSNLLQTVDRAGLDAAPFLTTTHQGTTSSNSWVSGGGTLTGEVTFNLHGLFRVDQFLLWNLNGGAGGPGSQAGIRDVVLLGSTDGVVFNPIAGGVLQFARVTTPIALPQTFTFAPVEATHLRFSVLNNWGDRCHTGFGEVAFQGVAVPEPSSAVLCGTFGAAALAWACRKRRQAASA